MDFKQTITTKFKNYLQQLGYSKNSVQILPCCVLDFLQYNTISHLHQITQQHIVFFYEHLQQRKHKRGNTGGLSESFIYHHIYGLKVFFNWLEQTEEITINPISNLKFKRPAVNHRQPLNQEEIQQLFTVADNIKEKAVLHLFYSCGLRRTEAVNLNISDIHFNTNLLYVREGKGFKRRVIPFNKSVAMDLKNYCKERENEVNCKCKEAFMLNYYGERISGDIYNKILKEILVKTTINKEVSLHHLRHSIATHLLENGLSIDFVREFLGHSCLETTQIYAKVNQKKILKL